MLSDAQVTRIATLVNKIVDVPLVGEGFEQIVFEGAIRVLDGALEEVLPAGLQDFVNDVTVGFDRSHTGDFIERLVVATNKRVDIPLLGEQQEEKVIRLGVELIVKGMSIGRTLDELLA